jgi:predicted RNase H-like HicB family nuclease
VHEIRRFRSHLLAAGRWRRVAEIEEISGCFALMHTREEAAEELKLVFAMIAEEEAEKSHA